MAIGIAEVGQGVVDPLPGPRQAPSGHQNVLRLRPVAAGVHGQGPADGARNPGIEFQSRQPGPGRGPGDHGVQRAGTRRNGVALGGDARERPTGQADDYPLDPAVTDDDIGADAQHRHRHDRVQRLQEVGEIVGVGRDEQHIGRAADPEPGEGAQRLVAEKFAADRGKGVTPRHFYVPLIPAKAGTQCFGRSVDGMALKT